MMIIFFYALAYLSSGKTIYAQSRSFIYDNDDLMITRRYISGNLRCQSAIGG